MRNMVVCLQVFRLVLFSLLALEQTESLNTHGSLTTKPNRTSKKTQVLCGDKDTNDMIRKMSKQANAPDRYKDIPKELHNVVVAKVVTDSTYLHSNKFPEICCIVPGDKGTVKPQLKFQCRGNWEPERNAARETTMTSCCSMVKEGLPAPAPKDDECAERDSKTKPGSLLWCKCNVDKKLVQLNEEDCENPGGGRKGFCKLKDGRDKACVPIPPTKPTPRSSTPPTPSPPTGAFDESTTHLHPSCHDCIRGPLVEKRNLRVVEEKKKPPVECERDPGPNATPKQKEKWWNCILEQEKMKKKATVQEVKDTRRNGINGLTTQGNVDALKKRFQK